MSLWTKLRNTVERVGGAVAGFAVGGPAGAAVGAGLAEAATGGHTQDVLKAAALGGTAGLAASYLGAGAYASASSESAAGAAGAATLPAAPTVATAATGAQILGTVKTGVSALGTLVTLQSYINPATGQSLDLAPGTPVPAGYVPAGSAATENSLPTGDTTTRGPVPPASSGSPPSSGGAIVTLALVIGGVLLIFSRSK